MVNTSQKRDMTAMNSTSPQPHASTSTSHIKYYKPYFSTREVERLSAKQRGKLSVSREERGRQQACGFIDVIGARCGFPRRTIATAQSLYMRFHLFFPYKDFNYVEVCLSALYVSSKLHDTLKKPRDIILSSYPLRYPQFVKKGSLDLTALDPRMIEDERAKVLGVERLILETICFKFGVEVGLNGVVKIGRALGLDKMMCRQAWRIAVDSYRTQAPLSYPPHVIALASIYASCIFALEAAFLRPITAESRPTSTQRRREMEIVEMLSRNRSWEDDYSTTADQVDDVAHYILDLYNTILSLPSDQIQTISQASPASPKDPSLAGTNSNGSTSTSSASAMTAAGLAYQLPGFWTSQSLTEVKIKLRETRPGLAGRRAAQSADVADMNAEEGIDRAVDEAIEGMGKNDKTVRFLWT